MKQNENDNGEINREVLQEKIRLSLINKFEHFAQERHDSGKR